MNDIEVLNKLNSIKDAGNVKNIDFLFASLLSSNKDVFNLSFNIIIDIKDNNFKSIIFNFISNDKYSSIKKDIVSICWQSSISFCSEISLFFDILINDDIEIAIEALSVIENCYGNTANNNSFVDGVDKLKAQLNTIDNELKRNLISNFLLSYSA